MFRRRIVSIAAVLSLGALSSCTAHRNTDVQTTIVSMERAALDRWGKGETAAYTDIYAQEITYFDPDLTGRVDGLPAMRELLAPYEGKIKVERYDMINPKVQVHGDVAVLSFNLIDYLRTPEGTITTEAWNSTEVYARIGGKWRIIHSHWSYPKPPKPATPTPPMEPTSGK
ncbi:MAG TPA: nuclear transport factor 2 family protein [Phycisphaerae bacterium]|nr:nuclear transport factor 2 family protein [Phycisphaerae bacterium]HNU46991.1 nuclear transport factor 2 family protein [Phycisphaerae bacterium]